MGSDLLRRVRWGNVARVGAAVFVAVAVVAWPRLTPPAPRVPDPVARPLQAAPVVPRNEGRRPPVRRRPVRVVRPRHRPRPRVRPRARRAHPRRSVGSGGTNPGIEGGGVGGSVVGGGTASRGRAPAPARDPAQTEFGFER